MSSVSSMLVVCSIGDAEDDDGGMKALDAWCRARDDGPGLTFQPLDLDAAGGDKYMQVCVFACGKNYFVERDLATAFPTIPWQCPNEAMLLINPEHGGMVAVSGDPRRPRLAVEVDLFDGAEVQSGVDDGLRQAAWAAVWKEVSEDDAVAAVRSVYAEQAAG